MQRRTLLKAVAAAPAAIELSRHAKAEAGPPVRRIQVFGMVRRFDIPDGRGEVFSSDGIVAQPKTNRITLDFSPLNIVGEVKRLQVVHMHYQPGTRRKRASIALYVTALIDEHVYQEWAGKLYWALDGIATHRGCAGEKECEMHKYRDNLCQLEVSVTDDPVDTYTQGLVLHKPRRGPEELEAPLTPEAKRALLAWNYGTKTGRTVPDRPLSRWELREASDRTIGNNTGENT